MIGVCDRVSAFIPSSSLAEIPIRQNLAVTGSINQHGRVQVVGGSRQRRQGNAAGFEIMELKPVQKFPRTQYFSQVTLGPRSNLLNRLVIRSLEALPLRDGLEWIVTCRRA